MSDHIKAALRRIMEKEIRSTRFCIICNYVSRIIDPLASRCVKVRFKPLPTNTMIGYLRSIANQENVQIADEALCYLMDTCEGDMRKATMNLHSAKMFSGNEPVTAETISEITGTIPQRKLESLFSLLKSDVSSILKAVEDLLNEGYFSMTLLNDVQRWILEVSDLSDSSKSDLLILLSDTENALNRGADEYLQLSSLFTAIHYEM